MVLPCLKLLNYNLSHFTTLKFIIFILNNLYCGLWCGLWWSVVICGGLWWSVVFRLTLLVARQYVLAGYSVFKECLEPLMGPDV